MAKEIKAPTAPAREAPGLLRRMLRRRRRENAQTEGDSGTMDKSALDLADIQGFILRGYRMPMVRHFLLAVATPAHARRQLGRLVSGDESDAPQFTTAEDWHVGFAPGPKTIPRRPPSQARLLPEYRHHVARTGGAGDKRTRPKPIVQVFWRVHRRSRATSGAGRRCRSKCAAELGGGFGEGHDHVLVTLHAISPEAMQSYSDRVCAWFAEGNAFREVWRQDGMILDGDARRPTRADFARFTSDTPTASPGPPFAAARTISPLITSSPASHGSSSCGKTPRTTPCRSRDSSV